MSGMASMASSDAMGMVADWSVNYWAVMFVMWWVMMAAMMLPSASPMILLFSTINTKRQDRDADAGRTGIFAAGYLIAWGAFSLLATSFQWAFSELALLTPMMASASVPFGALLLIAAGVYQLTPLKHACLRHCRAPIHYLSQAWRNGKRGALIMGLEHGAFCLGCCWVLMALLFYGGVMNVAWIAGLTLYVMIEKLVPAGHWVGSCGGILLIIWGAVLLVRYFA